MTNSVCTVPDEILIVDDTPASLRLMADILGGEGYRVRLASDGELALRSAKIQPPALILLDIKMPGMDGYEVCRHLKNDNRTRSIPIIFLSALESEEEKLKAFQVGGVDFISKPIRAAEALARVNTHLALQQAQKDLEIRNTELEAARDTLEEKVKERSMELQQTNLRLQQQIDMYLQTLEALRESEEKYRRIVDTANEGIWVLGSNSTITLVNTRLTEILGYSREEMNDRPATDFMFIDDIPDHLEKMKLRRQGLSATYERRFRSKDGQIVWTIVSATPIFDEAHHYQGAIGMFTDITQRKQAEESLRRLNRELHAISNCNLTLMRAEDEQALLNDICRIVCDEAGYRMAWVGYTKSDEPQTIRPVAWAGMADGYLEQCHLSWADTEHGQSPTEIAIRDVESACIQDFTTIPKATPWRDEALQRGYRSGIALPLKDENANIFGALNIYSTEVNAFTPNEVRLLEELSVNLAFGIMVLRARIERHRVATALKESEVKMRSILDNISIGVAMIGPEMEILELNRRMREWFPAVDLKQHPLCYQALNNPPRKAVCDDCPTQKTLQDGLVHEATSQTPQAGVVRNYRIVSSPIFDGSNQITAVIEIIEDITEKLHLESQLQQAQKMESVGRLAGGVAHDFNNMLGVIIGHADLALDEMNSAHPLFASLHAIRKAANHSADLTRQLLAFARKQTVTIKVMDLNETVEGMLKMLRRLIGEDIDLAWLPKAGLWPVEMDPSQIDQILVNLVVNSRDAISGMGKITIETNMKTFDSTYCATHPTFLPGEYVMLAVSDNGHGMDREIQDKVFEPFFTTKGIGEGTGLGLSTVYGIVKQNNGFINVYSEPDQGTTLRIYLPRFIGNVKAASVIEQPEPITDGQETLLVVEDEPAILDLIRIMLEKQGYQVLAASTPIEAILLAEAYAEKIDLLLTDVVMPEMNGRSLAQKLVAINPNLKCLFMSGYTANVIAHHGVLDEGVHFIQKPFSRRDMAAKIREVLNL